MGYLDSLLGFFKFTKDTDLVAATCLVLLLSSIIGGMLSSIFKAFGGPLKPLAFQETNGFRILLFYEICLVAVIFYYHMHVTGRVDAVQVIFWVTTMLSMPVLWFMGSVITQVLFWSKISKNKKAYREIVAKRKFAKHKKMQEQIREETKESKEAQARRAEVTAKGKKGHQATVKRRRAES
ncbi:MAG: hypothetical protein RIE87_05290 [Rhodospirillales bacterium]